MTSGRDTDDIPSSLDIATNHARSGRNWDKIYQYICIHPTDFFVILPGRQWSIGHQAVYHGDVNLLKRLLTLFSDQQIDIRSKTGDGKTLLDVAKEKQAKHKEMFTYIEHLFDQDELIEAAKASHWPKVMSLLEKNRYLANEKPPYAPYFLLHHVVMNGNEQILKQLLENAHLVTDVRSANNETPLQLATRLRRSTMCSLLQGDTHQKSDTSTAQCDTRDFASASRLPVKTFEPTYSTLPETHSQTSLSEKIQHVDTNKTIVMSADDCDEQTMEDLTCILSSQLFIDPVMASDGCTYERSAIVDWIKKYHSSPTTGALMMNPTVEDNVEMKRRVQRFRTSSNQWKD